MNRKGDIGWLFWIGVILIIVLILLIVIPLFFGDDLNMEIFTPSNVTAGENFNLTVRVENQNKNVSNLVVGYGQQSVLNPNNATEYNFTTNVFCPTGCQLPQTFIISLAIEEPGRYYIRAFGEYENQVFSSGEEIMTVTNRTQINQNNQTNQSNLTNITDISF
jgi:hypothetical protein